MTMDDEHEMEVDLAQDVALFFSVSGMFKLYNNYWFFI